jgi:uncharacterized protein (DUF697 family)
MSAEETQVQEETKATFSPITLSADEVRLREADRIITNRVHWSLGAGLVPVPLFDLAALATIQLTTVKSLAEIYDVPFRKDLAKSIITTLVGSALPVAVAGPLAGLMKMVPVVGWTTGALTMCMVGAAATYAVGKVFVKHFESGGTFLDFDATKMREYFAEKFEEGKKMASGLKKSKTA